MIESVAEIELIVFDMDGVLVDSTQCHAWAFEQLWTRCGLPAPEYEEIAGRTTRDVVLERTAHLAPDAETVAAWVAFKQARTLECFERRDVVYPDVHTVLSDLQARGFAIALGTGASRHRTEVVLRRMHARDCFRAIVTADDVTRGKPDPETYDAAIARAGSAPERSLVVEDSASGLRAALDAGARVVSVRSGARVDDPRFVGEYRDLEAFAESLPKLATAAGGPR